MQFNHRGPYSGVTSPIASGFPSVLPWNEATDLVDSTPENSVLLGTDGHGDPVRVDLEGESPHIIVSAPTGAGKSAVARSIAVQRMRRGDMVVILDAKRHSHRWAKKLAPLVHYASTVAEIGDALVQLGREVDRRNVVVDNWDGPIESAPVGPRIIVLFEEMNATMGRLKLIDRRLPEGQYRAQDGMADVVFMGRAVQVHMIGFAQLASYRASGGSEIIENFGTKVMIRYSPQAWRWLAADAGKPMTAPEPTGRGVTVYGGKARETQYLWTTEAEALSAVLEAVPAQRRARELAGSRVLLPEIWRQAITAGRNSSGE